jgi:hypothetical protein
MKRSPAKVDLQLHESTSEIALSFPLLLSVGIRIKYKKNDPFLYL